MFPTTQLRLAIPALAAAFLWSTTATAQPLAMNDPNPFGFIFRDVVREPAP